MTLGLDRLLRTRVTVDDDGHGKDLGAGAGKRASRLERRPARRRRVLEDDDALARNVGALDLAFHAVILRLLAHDERVDVEPARSRGVKDRAGDRIGAHRQTTDGIDVVGAKPGLLKHVEHDVTDEGGGLVVEGRATHVDVEVGLQARGKCDLSPHDGEVGDEIGEAGLEGIVGVHTSSVARPSEAGYPWAMRLATWNVNSARTRIARILDVLDRHDLDVLAIQEIKCRDDQFPTEALGEAGYEVATWGINQWNGVALISRVGISDVERGLPGQPHFRDVCEPRALGATCAGVRVWSLYVPHGRGLDDPHMAYKLRWLGALESACATWLDERTDLPLLLVGDFNVAPVDTDVWDIAAFEGSTHVSAPERQALSRLDDVGMREVTRPLAEGYTFWDYQKLRFPKNEGMRIDFAYASPALAPRVSAVTIDRDERKGRGASDHVPVILTIDEES